MGIRRNLAADLGEGQSNGASAGGKRDEADTTGWAGWAGWADCVAGQTQAQWQPFDAAGHRPARPDVRQHALTPFITLAAEPWEILLVFTDLKQCVFWASVALST
jgi:hypothetical protein